MITQTQKVNSLAERARCILLVPKRVLEWPRHLGLNSDLSVNTLCIYRPAGTVAATRVQKFNLSHAAMHRCYICMERTWCEANNKYVAKVKIHFIFSRALPRPC